ncbi:hypothetical protein GGI35DRAFT_465529 [Trichoderma velutinum]
MENHATGDDAYQLMVVTDGATIRGTNQASGLRPRQINGCVSEETVRHIAREMARYGVEGATTGYSTTGSATKGSTAGGSVERERVDQDARFRERYGEGFRLGIKGDP